MQCIQALAPITANVAPLDPIRDGDCGTPAPVVLKGIGAIDKVSFDPPLVLDCAMVAGLDRWLQDSVQPAAREAFSLPVSKIIGSSYACRNVYNLPEGHLSQHAFANAIDVPIFVLAGGRKVDLTHGWGPTQRDLIAAAKAEESGLRRYRLACPAKGKREGRDHRGGEGLDRRGVSQLNSSQSSGAR
jgi:hypothetical protein